MWTKNSLFIDLKYHSLKKSIFQDAIRQCIMSTVYRSSRFDSVQRSNIRATRQSFECTCDFFGLKTVPVKHLVFKSSSFFQKLCYFPEIVSQLHYAFTRKLNLFYTTKQSLRKLPSIGILILVFIGW